MRLDILTILPNLLEGPFSDSILQRAQEKELCEIHVHDIRSFSKDKHRKVDDYSFGGSAGMVMTIQPILDCVKSLQNERDYDEVIYMTPDGEQLKQTKANHLSLKKNLIIICGHYKGIDHRLRENIITMELSIGDYVLSGGELAAAVLTDSFQDNMLAPPVYTRPADYNGWKVPEVLRSGDFKKIQEWQENKALERTKQLRPDLLAGED